MYWILNYKQVSTRLMIISLFLYLFLGEFFIGFFQIEFFKIVLAILSLLFFIIYLCVKVPSLKDVRLYLLIFSLIIIYLFIWDFKTTYLNLVLVILYGFLLSKDYVFSIKLYKGLFWIQLVAVLFEYASQTILFNYVSSGIVNINEFNYEQNFDLFESTGFRPKGLFLGTLVASSFVIYFVLLFRNNLFYLFLSFIMAILINGRLAILIAGFTLLLKILKTYKFRVANIRVSSNLFSFILFPIVILSGLFLLYVFMSANAYQNLLDTFNFQSESNSGRLFRMFEGYTHYIFDYSIINQLFGNPSYELYDFWGRLIPPEAEFAGMLLEIGVVGLLIYIYYLVKIYKVDNTSIFNLDITTIGIRYVFLINVISMLIYRHCSGNLRGTMFWFIIWTILAMKHQNKKLL